MKNLTWEKVISSIVLFVSTLVVVVSIFAILLIWRLNAPIKDNINNTFEPINQTISTVTPALETTNQNIDQLSLKLDDLEKKLREAASKDATDTTAAQKLAELQKDITDRLNKAQDNFAKARENHPKLVAAVALAKNLPVFSPDQPDQSKLTDLANRLSDLKKGVEEFKTTIQEADAKEIAAKVRKETLTKAADRVAAVNDKLNDANQVFNAYNTQVEAINTLQQNLLFAVDASSIATTIFLIGLILAQGFPISKTWENLKKPKSTSKR